MFNVIPNQGIQMTVSQHSTHTFIRIVKQRWTALATRISIDTLEKLETSIRLSIQLPYDLAAALSGIYL